MIRTGTSLPPTTPSTTQTEPDAALHIQTAAVRHQPADGDQLDLVKPLVRLEDGGNTLQPDLRDQVQARLERLVAAGQRGRGRKAERPDEAP